MTRVSALRYSEMRNRNHNVVRRWIKRGMPCIRIPKGNRTWYLIDVEAADAWVKKNTRNEAPRKAERGEKWCPECSKFLPISAFWENQYRCKKCRGWQGGAARKRSRPDAGVDEDKPKPVEVPEAEVVVDEELDLGYEMLGTEPAILDLGNDAMGGDVFDELDELDKFG